MAGMTATVAIEVSEAQAEDVALVENVAADIQGIGAYYVAGSSDAPPLPAGPP